MKAHPSPPPGRPGPGLCVRRRGAAASCASPRRPASCPHRSAGSVRTPPGVRHPHDSLGLLSRANAWPTACCSSATTLHEPWVIPQTFAAFGRILDRHVAMRGHQTVSSCSPASGDGREPLDPQERPRQGDPLEHAHGDLRRPGLHPRRTAQSARVTASHSSGLDQSLRGEARPSTPRSRPGCAGGPWTGSGSRRR